MFKDRLLDTLKNKKREEKLDEEMSQAMAKIQKQKRLSSQEFLKVYETIRREGPPKMKYQNPEAWGREL